jgi:hypothetical protein
MAKLARETRLRQRREEKQARREARRLAADDPDQLSDTPIEAIDESSRADDGTLDRDAGRTDDGTLDRDAGSDPARAATEP